MKKLITMMMLLAALSFMTTLTLEAQVSAPGIPQSLLYDDLQMKIDHREFPSPDMAKIEAEDIANPSPYRAGVAVPVNLDINNSGEWTVLPDGGKIWRLSLKVEGAKALGVYYDNFWLPYGGELYLYDEGKENIIGAFTEKNNNAECTFATALIPGDIVTLEYYQPAEQTIEPLISISEVSYTYRGVYFEDGPDGKSVWCMINVICSPEGDDWQDEKQGVVKQYMKIGWGYYLCSGSLINNTEQDLTPYVLTAWHCGEGASVSDMNQWLFYFNYEASTCSGNWGPSSYSVSGCTKRAEGPYQTGSDFLLVELNSDVPSSYNPYYNGWDRTNTSSPNGVSIHHPAGDIKKISTYDTPLLPSQWNGNGVLSHWKAWWAETEHGTSITEGGSSGSPLFNSEGLIVGDLTGGPEDNCSNPLYSLYGKVYWSWDQMGTASSQRLKPWLDPGDYGVEKWEGTYEGTLPSPAFSADHTLLQVGEVVQFSDSTTGNPLEWEWTFEGGDPASYTGQDPPPVTYNSTGAFTVTLEASNTLGSTTLDSVDMILVGVPTADFSATNNYLESGETTDFTDETSGEPNAWEWTFYGGNPETSTDQNPTGILYDTQGAYDVRLIATNTIGTDTIIKEVYIVVDGPFADFEADLTSIVTGGSVTFTDISANNPTNWSWKFFGGDPGAFNGQDPPPITYDNPGSYNVKLTVSNELGSNFIIKEDYIVVGDVGLDEAGLESMIKIYPNPSGGNVTLELGREDIENVQLQVLDSRGNLVHQQQVPDGQQKVSIDLAGQPAGIYMLRLSAGELKIDRKITIVK
ncbi:MAG: PKD domain-containing protein [Bacteroidales bacterium]|jgi:PKD repeat protein|nr:PKD domain-containing protein [Bacteroidales bacterium]